MLQGPQTFPLLLMYNVWEGPLGHQHAPLSARDLDASMLPQAAAYHFRYKLPHRGSHWQFAGSLNEALQFGGCKLLVYQAGGGRNR